MGVLFPVIIFFMALTLIVLLVGVGFMMAGGKLNQKYANKLMVARVVCQGVLVVLVGLMFLIKH